LLPDVNEIRFTTPTKENLKSTVEFKTPFGWVTIHQLSLGYKTMVAWMIDLSARMFERYPDSENPLAEPAIVLVDEIDLHLHPKWQREIFDYLSEKFPKTQFIVTAHSPLIVQSAPKDANIVVLRKEGDHVVIDNDVESVQNWRLDQIMSSDLFGIESSRGPDTEKWLHERKQLLQKEILTKDEKTRLSELNKKAHALPTADNQQDIEAMEIIRKAAEYLKNRKA
jgi:predicted ATP-binding protein involved in virulence